MSQILHLAVIWLITGATFGFAWVIFMMSHKKSLREKQYSDEYIDNSFFYCIDQQKREARERKMREEKEKV